MSYWTTGKTIEAAALLAIMAIIALGIVFDRIAVPPEFATLTDKLQHWLSS